jgi:hypothetical protein
MLTDIEARGYLAQELYTALYRIVRQSLLHPPVGHDAIVAARAVLIRAERAGCGKPGATAAVFTSFERRRKGGRG